MNKRLDSKDVGGEKREKCGLNDHRRVKHPSSSFKKCELQQETRAVGGSSSLNVNKAAGHKERWREEMRVYS